MFLEANKIKWIKDNLEAYKVKSMTCECKFHVNFITTSFQKALQGIITSWKHLTKLSIWTLSVWRTATRVVCCAIKTIKHFILFSSEHIIRRFGDKRRSHRRKRWISDALVCPDKNRKGYRTKESVVLPLPLMSPDLNQNVNLWSDLKREVHLHKAESFTCPAYRNDPLPPYTPLQPCYKVIGIKLEQSFSLDQASWNINPKRLGMIWNHVFLLKK